MNVTYRPLPAAYLLSGLGFLLCSLPAWGGWKILPHHFGRYTVPPRIYGYPLDDDHAGYYGGLRYREYYGYGRGGILADFPGPLPNYNGSWFRYRQWPYSSTPEVYRQGYTWNTAQIVVRVPPEAEVWLEGRRMQSTGSERTYVSPPLRRGGKYVYQVRARWPEGRGIREQTREVVVQSGHRATVEFPSETELQAVPLPTLRPAPQKGDGVKWRQVDSP